MAETRQYRYIYKQERVSSRVSSLVLSWYVKLPAGLDEIYQKLDRQRCPTQVQAAEALVSAAKQCKQRLSLDQLVLKPAISKAKAKASSSQLPAITPKRYKGVHQTGASSFRVRINNLFHYTKSLSAAVKLKTEAKRSKNNNKKLPHENDVPLPSLAAHAKAMFCMYRSIGWLVPGDVVAACQSLNTCQDMFNSEPGLQLCSFLGKYQPWMDHLFATWQSLPKPPPRLRAAQRASTKRSDPDLLGRATFIAEVLRGALQRCSGDPMQIWSDNCGKRVSRHIGYLALMQSWGLLQSLSCRFNLLVLCSVLFFRRFKQMQLSISVSSDAAYQ